jgi:hypothetical protein
MRLRRLEGLLEAADDGILVDSDYDVSGFLNQVNELKRQSSERHEAILTEEKIATEKRIARIAKREEKARCEQIEWQKKHQRHEEAVKAYRKEQEFLYQVAELRAKAEQLPALTFTRTANDTFVVSMA